MSDNYVQFRECQDRTPPTCPLSFSFLEASVDEMARCSSRCPILAASGGVTVTAWSSSTPFHSVSEILQNGSLPFSCKPVPILFIYVAPREVETLLGRARRRLHVMLNLQLHCKFQCRHVASRCVSSPTCCVHFLRLVPSVSVDHAIV